MSETVWSVTAASDLIARALGEWSVQLNAGSVLLRLVLSLVFSAVIGWERSSKRHSAGLRTFMIVSLAGTLTALADSYIHAMTGRGFFILSAAAVVAGAVMSIHSIYYSSRNQIRGLTTAAGLWMSALIGVTIGMGLYTVSLVAFITLMVTLFWFPALEVFLKNRSNHFEIHLELRSSLSLQDFVTVIRELGITIDEIEQDVAYAGSGISAYALAISVSNAILKKYKSHQEIIAALGTLEYVYHIEEIHGARFSGGR